MQRVMDETDLKEKFTDHDIRAKVGSDAIDTARASKILAHADAKTTERSYRRKPVKLDPVQ